MPADPARLSLAELIAQDVRLEPGEAATIVRDLCTLAAGGTYRQGSAPLTPGKVTIDRSGRLAVAPGTSLSIGDLGCLFEVLLITARKTGTTRVPGALFYTMARAAGQVEAPPFATVAELEASLARFAIAGHWRPLADLYERWESTAPAREDGVAPLEPARAEPPPPEPPYIAASDSVQTIDSLDIYDAEPTVIPPSRPAVVPADDLAHLNAEYERRPVHIRPLWVAIVAAVGLVGGGLVALAISGSADSFDMRIAPTVATTGEEEAPAATPPRVTPAPTPASAAGSAPAASPASSTPAPLLMSRDANAEAVFSPSMSGSAVFFHAEGPLGSALKRADTAADGHVLGLATIVDDGAKNYHVQLSPDEQSVAFDSDRDGTRGVYIARADGTGVRRVSGEGYAAVPRWSPDGARLTFLRAEPERTRVWNLWMLDLRSGETTRLTNHTYGQVWAGSWFPDGQKIGYSHENRFIVLDIANERSSSYPSPIEGRLVRTPAVSPDGRLVIFQVYRDGGWLLDLNDGSMRRVLEDPSAEEFTWSPDGTRVAFHSRRNGAWGIWVMSPRGTP
ncbi:MAG TPA: hypothetical protein VFJ02_07905 [Vicinamibacterales bacterium]|nr:hypothetical protein [Vicinamibacterales bacterium]